MKVDIKKSYYYKTKRFWAGILLAQFLWFFTFSKIQNLVDLFSTFFEFQRGFHQQIFSALPFSAGDLLYILLGILLLVLIFKSLKKKSRNSSLLKLLIIFNIFYFAYQLFWGMLYFKKPIADKLPKGAVTLDETKAVALKYLTLCKKTRLRVKEDHNGIFKITDLGTIKHEILQNQQNLPAIVRPHSGVNRNAFKPSFFKGVMSYTGILGYYNPFTAEAQYNAELPATFLPFTLAHESMHQLGFAREQEANFTAYLLGKNSSNLELKYSTEYYVLKSVLNSLAKKDPGFVNRIVQSYSPAMKRDRDAEIAFANRHRGALDSVFAYTNDLFLKSNRQEGSVTYSFFVHLMIRYERTMVSEQKKEPHNKMRF